MRNKAFYIMAAFLLLAVSCQKKVMQTPYGTISFLIEDVVVEAGTKAAADGPDVNDFNVRIWSDANEYTYVYSEIAAMGNILTVPVGAYSALAESVSEEVSLTEPDEWGQVRYAAQDGPAYVSAGGDPAVFKLRCTMANTAVFVSFEDGFGDTFSDYKVTAYTTEDRKLEYTALNTSAENAAAGYFIPSTLYYEFVGTLAASGAERTLDGSVELQAATHQYLKFKITTATTGSLDIDVTVDTSFETVEEDVLINPNE